MLAHKGQRAHMPWGRRPDFACARAVGRSGRAEPHFEEGSKFWLLKGDEVGGRMMTKPTWLSS